MTTRSIPPHGTEDYASPVNRAVVASVIAMTLFNIVVLIAQFGAPPAHASAAAPTASACGAPLA